MLDDYGSGTSQGSDEGSTTSTDGGVSATSTLLCTPRLSAHHSITGLNLNINNKEHLNRSLQLCSWASNLSANRERRKVTANKCNC